MFAAWKDLPLSNGWLPEVKKVVMRRYSLVDTTDGSVVKKFTSKEYALKDLKTMVGAPGRFALHDRQTRKVVAESV